MRLQSKSDYNSMKVPIIQKRQIRKFALTEKTPKSNESDQKLPFSIKELSIPTPHGPISVASSPDAGSLTALD
jgi:hypothetical protein